MSGQRNVPGLKHTVNNKEREMSDLNEEFKQELGVKWVKAESGNTYLCPSASLNRLDNPSEDDLQMICVDESMNPQNE
jgi:hypothetical protein